MTEGQHTEGTLTRHPQSNTSLVVGKRLVAACGGYQSNVPGEDDQADNEANARRLTACWNACMGISTETLERLGEDFERTEHATADYWKTRYLLLGAKQKKAESGLVKFASKIARMTHDGEEIDGKEFVMENDDAVSTLNELISEARDLASVAQTENGLVEATDYKRLAYEFAELLGFCMDNLRPSGTGLVLDQNSGKTEPWRKWIARYIEKLPDMTIDHDVLEALDLPAKARRKRLAEIAAAKAKPTGQSSKAGAQ